jgi:hypothetical protein
VNLVPAAVRASRPGSCRRCPRRWDARTRAPGREA